MFKRKQFLVLIAVVVTTVTMAQDRKQDTLNPDVINVIKPYTPTISDAFKVKEAPVLDDKETTTKKEVTYNIVSFPVASPFTRQHRYFAAFAYAFLSLFEADLSGEYGAGRSRGPGLSGPRGLVLGGAALASGATGLHQVLPLSRPQRPP